MALSNESYPSYTGTLTISEDARARYIRERKAELTTERLDASIARDWHEWYTQFKTDRPEYLWVSLGDRAELAYYATGMSPSFEDLDSRHPDGPRIRIEGRYLGDGELRAVPNRRVLQAIRDKLLTASWTPDVTHRLPPQSLEERIGPEAAAAWRQFHQATAKRLQVSPGALGGGGRLII